MRWPSRPHRLQERKKDNTAKRFNMIAVINYGMGNIGSIINMLKKIGAQTEIAETPETLKRADKILLPGVGTFDNGMKKLKESHLIEAIQEETLNKKKPFLGICLGMQLLGTKSEEGKEKGLNFIEFETRRFKFEENSPLKIPHMGWDMVTFQKRDNPILKDITEQQRYYFVHSYHAVCRNRENILMTCDYSYEFAAAVVKDNIYGMQFHPEKSHRFGMKLLENFVRSV